MFILAFLSTRSSAQKLHSPEVNLSYEAHGLNGFRFTNLDLHIALKKNFTISMRSVAGRKESKLILSYRDSKAHDKIFGKQIVFGKRLFFSKKNNLRFHLAAGVGYYRFDNIVDWQKEVSRKCGLFFGYCSNKYKTSYNFEREQTNSWVFVFNPRIELVRKRKGFILSSHFELSKKHTYFGLGVGYLFNLYSKKVK